MSTKLTRRQLYDLVWSKPIQKLADELGISDRGLAKICARHRVPSPPRGYWAKVAAGQTVRRPLFRELGDSLLDRVEISSTFTALPEETRDMIRRTKAEKAARPTRKDNQVDVLARPTSIEKLHPAIASTAQALRKLKLDECGSASTVGAGLCGVIVHPDCVERAISILHNLAVALEAEGLHLQPDGERMKVAVESDHVVFTLTETIRRQPHVPTDDELQQHERQQERRSRAAERKNWDLYMSLPYQKPWPEFDRIHAGKLVLTIDTWADGLRKTWGDGKTQTIESMLDSIILGLRVILAHKKNDRERREEDERRRAELARRQSLSKKRKEREQNRIKYLRRLIELQREVAGLKRWLASLPPQVAPDQSTEFGRMLIWANARLVELEKDASLGARAPELEEKSLFPKIDDLHDPLGEPPEPKGYW